MITTGWRCYCFLLLFSNLAVSTVELWWLILLLGCVYPAAYIWREVDYWIPWYTISVSRQPSACCQKRE